MTALDDKYVPSLIISKLASLIILFSSMELQNSIQFKVVLESYHRYFFGVKVKTVKLIVEKRFLAAKSGLNVRTYSK